MFDYLIVGAGFAGSVLAERLAAGSKKKFLICDNRPHIGGNAYDHYNEAGILVHKYGPHIFHINARHVTADGKHSFCEFEAPRADACREHAASAGLPVDGVIPLGMEIGPGQFE